jgi:cytochrome c
LPAPLELLRVKFAAEWSVADASERRAGTKGEATHDDKDADRGRRANCHVDGRRNGARYRQGRSFKKCLICHSIGPGAQNKVGPAQNGLDGRKAGSVPNYQYSDANKKSGIVWNEATFNEYIKDPKAKIPGTKMVFAGIKNDQEINDLWAYLKQFDANGNIKK